MEPARVSARIVQNIAVNHDCHIISFTFPHQAIPFTIGEHFRIIHTLKTHEAPEGEEVVRKYTPINPCSQIDRIDFLVKIYRPNVHPDFPHGGKLTPFLEQLKAGDEIKVEGPYGKFQYQAGGIVTTEGESKTFKKIFFIAAGSGITPIFQTMIEISKMKGENIQLVLLFANKTEEDIVLRKEIEEHSHRIQVHYILDKKPNEQWQGFEGHVSQEILEKCCPLDEKDTLYVHCGPFPFNKAVRMLFVEKFPHSSIFKF